jgi:KipI family sensor histidine kinase inhibitor
MSDSLPPLAWRSMPSGDGCLLLEFGTVLSIEANHQAASAAALLNQAWREGGLAGLTDIVPGMVTVGLHYRPECVEMAADQASPYAALAAQVTALLSGQTVAPASAARHIEIPVCYGGEFGPDLEEMASFCGLSAEALIERHTRAWLDVLMVGFAPGHPYIGILDPQLNPPRRSTPRTLVKRGSIGLANRQTNVYPVDSPGGWNLIGRTPWNLFDTANAIPCRLQSGDKVRFLRIDAATFAALSAKERP